MVAITEQAVWAENIRQIETTDPVQGGEGGIDNIPHQQLANRTAFLKKKLDDMVIPVDNSQVVQDLQKALEDEVMAREDGDLKVNQRIDGLGAYGNDLETEIKNRIEGDDLLRGSLASSDGEVSLASLLARIKSLEKLTSNMVIGSYIIQETTHNTLTNDEHTNVDRGHISIQSVTLSEVYNFAATPSVDSFSTVKKDYMIMNGRVDITRDFVNQVIVPVPSTVETVDQVLLEYTKGVVTKRYGGGDYEILSDDLTMQLDTATHQLTIDGIWINQIKVLFK